ncbi:probable glycosyltransferase At5g03795 [Nymphaea colorata]|nr:probable glycosyltransferase At5g03795 [Nymphaea colorata]
MDFRFRNWRIGAKNVILLMVVMTSVGAIFQNHALPHPNTFWSLFSAVTVPPYKTLNNEMQAMEYLPFNDGRERFPTVSVYRVNDSSEQALSIASDAVVSTSNVTVVARSGTHLKDDGSKPTEIVESAQQMGDKNNSSDKYHILESSRESRLSNSIPNAVPAEAREKKSIGKSYHIPKLKEKAPEVTFFSDSGHTSSHEKKEMVPVSPDQALLYAKNEIKNAPAVRDDPDLYPPIFRDVSVFKRSYELMEKILKVYIYPDGERPVFHRPLLKGIYASEGWFMKLMEQNRQFVVKDPKKAHLFYLPYSSHQLEIALYVSDSHNIKPLSLYLRDYVKKISSKYRFWKRARGADHFLVACHDWAPYTTKEHEELHHNTIKALCNADVSEGVFVPGKDVSLPETTVRNPRRPLKDLGGKPVSQRPILAFFAGNMHGRVRPVLLKYWGDKIEDMRIYGPLPNQISRKMSYIQHMKSSKYCICPRGYEVNSPRIVEAIYYECVPVIIADNFVPPFNDTLNWNLFSVTVAEKEIPNLRDILLAIPFKKYMEMQMNVKQVQKHFLWHSKPVKYDIFHMILHSIWFNRLSQI